MWYKINGELINLNRVVDIYIEGERDLVFVLDVSVAGAGGGETYTKEFRLPETTITFSNTSKRDECFSKLVKALKAITL